MREVDITIEICGMSGDGTIAAGLLLNSALTEAGFNLLAFDSYPAEIRGFGRCVTHTRAGTQEILALSHKVQVLISLDDEQSRSRVPHLDPEAVILFDNQPVTTIPENQAIPAHVGPDMHLFGIPFGNLSAQASGSARSKNLAALGGFAALFGVSPEPFGRAIEKKFLSKGRKVYESNLTCFNAGYRYTLEKFKSQLTNRLSPQEVPPDSKKALLSGNDAIARGALAAKVHAYFGYPITPATPVLEYLAKALPGQGGAVMQMEDEISSIGGGKGP
jgi:2-oxoglutarate/2-oxoacid ferredoxin oxidoreductase subunit alpha